MSFEKAPAEVMPLPIRISRHEAPQRPDDPGVDLKEIVAIVVRRRAWVFCTTAALMLLVLLYLSVASPIYTSSVQILVEPAGQKILESDATSEALPPDGGIALAESQLRILESRNVLSRVVASEGLASDPEFVGKQKPPLLLRWLAPLMDSGPGEPETDETRALRALAEKISVKRPEKAFVIDVFVSSHDRLKSARLANAIGAAYLADQSDTRAESARRASASLTARLADLREGVRQAEEAAERYKFQHNTVAVPGQLVSLATNEALVGLRDLERNVDAARAVYQSFLVRARQIGEEATLDRTNARIISSATPPLKKSWPPGGLLLGLSLVAGLSIGTGLALVRDFLDGKIHTRRQLHGSSHYPVVEVIPRLRAAASLPKLLRSCSRTGYGKITSEPAFLRLHDSLRSRDTGCASKIVMVTSCCSGEGKSTIALNLALAAAQDGERVLLIDADLRGRSISRRLMMQARKPHVRKGLAGLGDILGGLSTLNSALLLHSTPNFAVLPAGSSEGIGARIDRSELLEKLFSPAQGFDLIIIDSGSVTSDRFVKSLAAVAEEIILVVRAGRVRPEDLDLATATLGESAHRIRGIILNEVKC
jgi:uncharacterized protein involved in exopolysaccharide biosynthesis/Mrp family chromosome partitioning ATPase